MTCCVAALCDEGKSIILVADRMVGMGMIESEPDIKKVFWLHKYWRVMLAGNDIAPAFPILDTAKSKFGRAKEINVTRAMENVYGSYCEERNAIAEAMYLTPRGSTLRQFNSPASDVIHQSSREEIAARIERVHLEVSLIVAGFDSRGKGHIFSVDDYEKRGRPQRRDIPGYHAIGSGGDGAVYMMAY